MPLRAVPVPAFVAACLAALALALALASGTASAATARHALLVGVSELAGQNPSLWLAAPRNDVRLMRDTLRAQGFAAADIAVLADGVEGGDGMEGAVLPTRRAIDEAFARLLARAASGDFVLLYFSGHGVRQRDAAKRYQEPDGLAEAFLARDAGGNGTGGLRDTELDRWIGALLARGVFVAAIFDTCAATSMTRASATVAAPPVAEGPAGDEVRWRGLRPAQLQPAAAPGEPGRPDAALPEAAPVARARYVAFFASESHQVTPELRLPRQAREARPQGLLTWAFAESLRRRPATWRALYDQMLALYPPVIDELSQRFPLRELPSPVAEGSLDAPLFANAAAPATTRPAWPARRSGAGLALATGALDGLVAGQAVRVEAVLDDGARHAADSRVDRLDADGAQLALPPALAALGPSAQFSVSPVAPPAALALRLAPGAPMPPGLRLAYPASVRHAGPGEAPQVRWDPAARRWAVLDPALRGAIGADAAAGHGSGPDDEAARRALEGLARAHWLLALGALAQGDTLDGFEAGLEIWRGAQLQRAAPLREAARLLPLAEGERAALSVRNESGQSIDLLVAGLDPRAGWRAVYPDDPGETNRFERGSPGQPAAKRFELPWLGAADGARLLVLATPARALSAPRLFGLGPAASGSPGDGLRLRGEPRAARGRYAALLSHITPPTHTDTGNLEKTP